MGVQEINLTLCTWNNYQRYAQPPTGENRFKSPIPVEKDDQGVINASKISNLKCPQVDMLDPTSTIGQEDCLFLNIYIPKNVIENPSDKVPVMFYIHGGALIMQSNNIDEFGPKHLVEKGNRGQ